MSHIAQETHWDRTDTVEGAQRPDPGTIPGVRGLKGFMGGGEILLGSLFGAGTMLDRLLELRDLNRGHASRYWGILRRERCRSLESQGYQQETLQTHVVGAGSIRMLCPRDTKRLGGREASSQRQSGRNPLPLEAVAVEL